MTMPKQRASKSDQMTLPSPKIVVLFHIKTSYTFTAVQIIQKEFSILVVRDQKYITGLSLILLVELVQVTTIIYFCAFQMKKSDYVTNLKALYQCNGGSGSPM